MTILRRRNRFVHLLVMLSSALGSIADAVRGLWGARRNRWLVPLIVFLGLTGLLLIAAASAPALAPFLYSIF